jgi:hypothetical protein
VALRPTLSGGLPLSSRINAKQSLPPWAANRMPIAGLTGMAVPCLILLEKNKNYDDSISSCLRPLKSRLQNGDCLPDSLGRGEKAFLVSAENLSPLSWPPAKMTFCPFITLHSEPKI